MSDLVGVRHLLSAIITQAILDQDLKWFRDENEEVGSFVWCCEMLDLSESVILRGVKKLYEKENAGDWQALSGLFYRNTKSPYGEGLQWFELEQDGEHRKRPRRILADDYMHRLPVGIE